MAEVHGQVVSAITKALSTLARLPKLPAKRIYIQQKILKKGPGKRFRLPPHIMIILCSLTMMAVFI